ncbi:dynein heavy chain and region D6 of dynein motor-domain-containing protein [Blastocladiella britannica]|nr:dynein heavy chain and region D6 of dynein motor-domain-containing protein [Blastocladiella britannica]
MAPHPDGILTGTSTGLTGDAQSSASALKDALASRLHTQATGIEPPTFVLNAAVIDSKPRQAHARRPPVHSKPGTVATTTAAATPAAPTRQQTVASHFGPHSYAMSSAIPTALSLAPVRPPASANASGGKGSAGRRSSITTGSVSDKAGQHVMVVDPPKSLVPRLKDPPLPAIVPRTTAPPRGTAAQVLADVDAKISPGKQFQSHFDYIAALNNPTPGRRIPEFIYLRPRNKDPAIFNPYDLVVASYNEVNKTDFYTISAHAVTHYTKEATDVSVLADWIREHDAFKKIIQIPFFAKYRIWKSFSTWRRNVRRAKQAAVRKALATRMFSLDPHLSVGLLAARRACETLQRTAALQLPLPEVTWDIENLAHEQHAHVDSIVTNHLAAFDATVRATVTDACTRALSLAGCAIDREELVKLSFTQQAARRAECRRLERFVKLIDYIKLHALHMLAMNATQDMLIVMLGRMADARALSNAVQSVGNVPAIAEDMSESFLANVTTRTLAVAGYEPFAAAITKLISGPHPGSVSIEDASTLSPEALDNLEQEYRQQRTFLDVVNQLFSTVVVPARKNPLLRVVLQLSDHDNRVFMEPALSEIGHMIDGATKQQVAAVDGVSMLTNSFDFIVSGEAFEEPDLAEGATIAHLIADDVYYSALGERVRGCIHANYQEVVAFARSFDHFRDMFVCNQELDLDAIARGEVLFPGVDESNRGFTTSFFEAALALYSQQIRDITALPDKTVLGNYLADITSFKEKVLPSPQRCFASITAVIPPLAREKNGTLLDEVNHSVKVLGSRPTSVEMFVEYLQHLDSVKSALDSYDERYAEVSRLYALIDQYKLPIIPTDLAMFQTLRPTLRQLKDAVDMAEETREESVTRFSGELEKHFAELVISVNEVRVRAQNPTILNPNSPVDEVMAILHDLGLQFEALLKTASQYGDYQAQFKVPKTQSVDIEETKADLDMKISLWSSFHEWEALTHEWDMCPFDKINTDEMSASIQGYLKIIYNLDKGLPPNDVVPKLKAMVEQYRGMFTTIVDLRNPALKPRHWDKIQETIGKQLARDDTLTLAVLRDANVFKFREEIANISAQAASEAALEEMLQKIIRLWADTDFIVLPYRDNKDVFILGGVEDIQTVLDDSQVTLATIKASRHLGPIKSEVEKWDKQLTLFADTLEAWTVCQRNWLYLEPIFSAPDIQRQLPEESKMFAQVDRNWKDIMRRAARHPNAMKCGTTAGTLETFQQSNELLEKIQKCLEEYLESKRLLFPRFYFLSNDELLEILSQTKNPQAVQPHLGKCFDAIKSLEFSPEPKSIDILAMLSPEGEKVSFVKPIKARGNVEAWLSAVEEGMFSTVRRLLKLALADFDPAERQSWLLEHTGQVVLTASQVMWCAEVTKCLESKDPTAALRVFKEKAITSLAQCAGIVRGELTKLQRAVMGALITIDVHARDIIIEMIDSGVTSLDDFGWLKQLRYYWDAETDVCIVRMSDTAFNYGCEYLGCSPRLVITPLTDRCYLTLTGAIAINLGGSPLGPAGTGKTETVKDLAKALARQCVVFNCSDSLDYKMMGKFFAGLAQSGAWCCFDEFNRIDIEVLSVIAQQLLTIKSAKDSQVSRFMFEGKDIRLIPSCAAYITMNPGYAGRQELPDNLKALFRPIAMMIPDYGLIAEIMLFSEGFEDAKLLAGKVVNLYKLCSEQLSQQDHYDFGMRAVKSVLVMAGQLKRSNPTIQENIVLIRSLRDSNLPKFLADDVPLFLGILQDLFPGVVIPDQDFGALKAAIESTLEKQNFVVVPRFVDRIIQFYDTTRVRHGVMLVGPTGGGKTVAYQVLAAAMSYLHTTKPDFENVQLFPLNPKCITMDELYGAVNLSTMEWRDGLIGNITRQQVSDNTNDEKWTVFDGPVDALWIENLNTVLDDNKLLCLTNGERIKLNNSIRMIFEVMDLAVASPATVSRCGMVYMDPANLGWRPYVKRWMATVASLYLKPEQGDYLNQLFEHAVDEGLYFVRKQKELIPTVNLNLVISLCRLLTTFLVETDIKAMSENDTKTIVGYIFIFCFTWSIGGNIHESCHDAFDTFARELFERGPTVDCPVPGGMTIFSFFVHIKQRILVPWEDSVSTFQYQSTMPYFEIMVPTVDTLRFQFLTERLLQHSFPTLLTGTTGVGKSVIVQELIARTSKTKDYIPINLNFSAQTTSAMTQQYLELKLEKKKKNTMGAPTGSRIVIFVDDLNMPKQDTYGAQPPIELLRQFLDSGGFYDREKLQWRNVEDVSLLSACAPPGGGRNPVTPRLIRHFNVLNVPMPSDASLARIFKSILDGFLKPFSSDVRSVSEAIVNSSIELYNRMCAELLPTPAKSHYTFNLRDLSKVIQGITQIKPVNITTRGHAVAVFAHEAARIFHDRLIDSTDRAYFQKLVEELVSKNFSENMSADPIMFGDFSKRGVPREERIYAQFNDLNAMGTLLEDYLEEYNVTLSRDMRLIFFLDCKQHIARLSRIIRQPRGNALIVGVGGTGKKSLTRLACHMSEYQCIEVELTRTYGMIEWREDIKKLYRLAGLEGKNTVFLLTDTQIKTEAFLEDINGILNTGDVPNLFDMDEREQIIGNLRQVAREKGYPEDRDTVYQFFINRVRDNLHIVFATSPVGETFRNRCRMFPSLVNCCTIDWFDEWPHEALLSVSKRFLEFVDLGEPEVKEKMAQLCVDVHTSVSSMATRFYAELRRRFYTTPTSYLELISLYIGMLQEKRKEIGASRDRLKNGLQKLAETNDLVASMQVTLTQLGPELKVKAADVETLMIKIAKDQEVADGVKKTVAEEEKFVKQQAAQTEAIAREAQKDLDEALPALEAAYKALDSLDKKDVAEMKAFAKPPELVVLVLEAVCVLFKVKPDWDSSKKLLSDPQFLRKIQEYDKDSVNDALAKKLRKYVESPNFTPEAVEKVSRAARSMCMWVLAMDIYTRVNKEVEPKRKRLNEAQSSLEATKAKLDEKTRQLQDVEDQLLKLKQQYEESVSSKKVLSERMDQTTKRMERASKLTTALADEQIRWTDSVAKLNKLMEEIVGNVFVAAACVAYFGAFTSSYRREMIDLWTSKVVELGIPVAEQLTLADQLGDPVQIREWNVQGLPADELSTENGILVTRGRRWPLMIDPQGQANRWIRNMESGSDLKIVKLSDPKFLRALENAVRMGQPVLIEDVGEQLDPALEPLLLKQTVRQGGRLLMKLGDSLVEYDKNFKLYITTKISNPHYLPEVCIKVTIINFTVTKTGLEGQLLADVVKLERPELEEQRNTLILSISNDKRQLKEIEEKILRLLYNSQGNILDDEELILTLNQSKVTSAAITDRLVQAEQTEKAINTAREKYRPVALRGSILYFVVADLAEVDGMYQFSLKYFKNLFTQCIVDSPKGQELSEHVAWLCDDIMMSVFRNVSRGLFEQHKMIFSLMMCVSVMRDRGDIKDDEWNFFLRGSTSLIKDMPAKPQTRWLTDAMWRNCCALSGTIPVFTELTDHISSHTLDWEVYIESDDPYSSSVPGISGDKISPFQRLLVVKVLREEMVVSALVTFIRESIGSQYIDIPPLDLRQVYNDMNATTPLVFVLSSGSDPVSGLLKLASGMGFGERLHMISLGQGQGPIAEALLLKAMEVGDWLFLQNCHLAASWMPKLENKVKEIVTGEIKSHTTFRLFLSSMPSKVFPVSVLQESVKVTNEPPKGLRANIARSFADIPVQLFDTNPPQGSRFRKLAFTLCFFNAIIQERKKFGPLGWNISYDWSNSDLEVSIVVLKNFLSKSTSIPWDALRYLTGEISFGGRVTDDWDRRTMRTLLNKYYSVDVLDDNFPLSPSGIYVVPADGNLASFRSHIDKFPFTEEPSVFGMHENANVSYQLQETKRLLRTVLDVQPRLVSSGGGRSAEETVTEVAQSILSRLPALLVAEANPRIASAGKPRTIAELMFRKDPNGRMENSLSTVLLQECARFNKLLAVIRVSLENLIKAIRGLVVMSAQLELVFQSLTNNLVPGAWANVAYPSLKPLASWVDDLILRVTMLHTWLERGQPRSFWLPGFFFPQGFLTSVFQNHARRYNIPIDSLKFKFVVQLEETMEDYPAADASGGDAAVSAPIEDGVLIRGMFIEGARWDRAKEKLQDSFPMEMFSTMPLVRFIPAVNYQPTRDLYVCPLYKTSARAGTLSTTGQSTNFVCPVHVPSDTTSDYWIQKGVALLMQLND